MDFVGDLFINGGIIGLEVTPFKFFYSYFKNEFLKFAVKTSKIMCYPLGFHDSRLSEYKPSYFLFKLLHRFSQK